MLILIETSFSPASVDGKVLDEYNKLTNQNLEIINDEDRHNKHMIDLFHKYDGKMSDNPYTYFKLVDVPDDVNWRISEYDCSEFVEEVHRTWK